MGPCDIIIVESMGMFPGWVLHGLDLHGLSRGILMGISSSCSFTIFFPYFQDFVLEFTIRS
jgi:hypothetical protein